MRSAKPSKFFYPATLAIGQLSLYLNHLLMDRVRHRKDAAEREDNVAIRAEIGKFPQVPNKGIVGVEILIVQPDFKFTVLNHFSTFVPFNYDSAPKTS